MLALLALSSILGLARSGPDFWADGSVRGLWRAIFSGEGRNSSSGQVMTLAPKPAKAATETHANLIVSTETFEGVDYSVKFRTLRQLRAPAEPNPWEVGWIVWNYRDATCFYYLALKPNGWEVGKADSRYPGGQRFLVTGSDPFPIGHWYSVRVRHLKHSFAVWVDSRPLIKQTDSETPYEVGSVGIYTEDAVVEFEHLNSIALP